jgi:ABC-type multidrug transport system fused ATPase/permease subunit
MYKPMQDFAKMTDGFTKASVGYERIREVMETSPAVQDRPGARHTPPLQGEIEFENVGFGYAADRQVLTDVTLKAAAGQMTALVGPTGSGKTTIAALMGRFYDPNSGKVAIDGTDIRDFEQKSLHDQISFVLQENILFHAPIWQNIAYGKPDATRDEVRRAAELANAHEFISGLPEGYDTMVGERGVTLSGGQRQRIAIARAILADPQVLILDDATSAVDATKEHEIRAALAEVMEGRTTLVIAHRPATIALADRVAVLEGGRVVEQGTHDELIRRSPRYRELLALEQAA